MKRVIIASRADDFIYVLLRNGDPIAKGSYEQVSKKSVDMSVPTDIKKFSKSKFNSYFKMAKEARRPNPLKFAVNRYINDNRDEFRNINSATDTYSSTPSIICFDIEWDTDGADAAELGLPESVIINNPSEEMINDLDGYGDSISNYLSDEYEYLVNSFVAELSDNSNRINSSTDVGDNFIYDLATRLVKFMQDYDWFDYVDALDVDVTEEDVIESMAKSLSDKHQARGIMYELEDILSEEPDVYEDEIHELIDDLHKLL